MRAYREAGVDELVVPDFTLGPRDQKLATLDRFLVPDFTLGPRDQKLATLDRFIREVAAPLR